MWRNIALPSDVSLGNDKSDDIEEGVFSRLAYDGSGNVFMTDCDNYLDRLINYLDRAY